MQSHRIQRNLSRSPHPVSSTRLQSCGWPSTAWLLLVALLITPAAWAQGSRPTSRGADRDWPRLDAVGAGGPSRGGAGELDPDVGAWSRWWALNRDGYLPRFPRVFDAGVASSATSAAPGQRPSATTRHGVVTRTLQELLEGERDNQMAVACLMALGRIGDPPAGSTGPGLLATIRPYVADGNQEVRESAVLALGVLGGLDAIDLLDDLLLDTKAGRAATRGGRVDRRLRAFAAYALGVAGAQASSRSAREVIASALRRVLETERSLDPDLGVACVIAYGLVPLDVRTSPTGADPGPTTRRGQVRFLEALLDDRKLERRIRAQVPVAIARLADGLDPATRMAVLDGLLDELVPARRHAEAERLGLVQAVGRLGDDDEDAIDVRVRKVLRDVAEDGRRIERHAALVALARVAGRAGDGPAGEAAAQVRTFLAGIAVEGSSFERPWAVLALGLLERARGQRGLPPADGTRMLLVQRHAEAKTPDERAAFAVAFGLMAEVEALPALREQARRGDERARGAAMLALGWMRDPEVADVLAEQAVQPGLPSLAREAAIGLALMGDKSVATSLGGSLTASRFLNVQVTRILALGYLGDARAVRPLLRLATADGEPVRLRAWAVASLGLIGAAHPLPWSQRIAEDVVWWDVPTTLLDPARERGVLDRL